MIEGNAPPDSALQAKAEMRFKKIFLETIKEKPWSVNKPLKFNPNSVVWVESMNETATVQKGDREVYLLRLKNGEFIVCRESDIEFIN